MAAVATAGVVAAAAGAAVVLVLVLALHGAGVSVSVGVWLSALVLGFVSPQPTAYKPASQTLHKAVEQ